MNTKLVVEYDGTNYWGFQVQPGGPTIQASLEEALSKLAKEPIRVIGAGRTDSGVHAYGQVVNFHSNITVPVERLPLALNSLLPRDIRVKGAETVSDDFHARYSAVAKTYFYQIYSAKTASAFLRNYALWLDEPLDWDAVGCAGQLLLGTHDFAGFMASGSAVKSTIRTMIDFQVRPAEGAVTRCYFTANGFLYNMVRNIMGTLLEIGQGKRQPQDIGTIIRERERKLAGPTAPPHGLFLHSVSYDRPRP